MTIDGDDNDILLDGETDDVDVIPLIKSSTSSRDLSRSRKASIGVRSFSSSYGTPGYLVLVVGCLFLAAIFALFRPNNEGGLIVVPDNSSDGLNGDRPPRLHQPENGKTVIRKHDQSESNESFSDSSSSSDESSGPRNSVDAPPSSDEESNNETGGFSNIDQTDSTLSSDTLSFMQATFIKEKKILFDRLRKEYGKKNFRDLFLQQNDDGTSETVARSIFRSPNKDGPGWDRMKRKVTIKLLQALEVMDQSFGGRRRVGAKESIQPLVPFTWVSGGHSAAAAHGNLYNQSYVAFMERDLGDMMKMIGIDFKGKNYAVGGARSGPQIAWCQEAMFGTFDILSWDYGMTDANRFYSMEMYFYRAGLSPTNPAAIGFTRTDYPERTDILKELEDSGMTTLYMDHKAFSDTLTKIPDTFGLDQTKIDAMPEFVKNFNCDGGIETGDPYCADEKFSLDICPTRKYRTGWHPGWKWHALHGNMMALLLVELFEESFADIVNNSFDPVAYLSELKLQEDNDYDSLRKSNMPSHSSSLQPSVGNLEEIVRLFYKRPNVCHLALLPAETRYKGILTETNGVDMFDLEQDKNLLLFEKAKREDFNGSDIRLVGENTRQDCPVVLNIDHYDFWFLTHAEGSKEMVLPNSRESVEYVGEETLQGVIVFCFANCPWDNCPDGNILDGVANGTLAMKVNDQPVTSMSERIADNQDNCFMLFNEDGYKFTPDDDGRFKLLMRVKQPGHYLRISSVIIW